MGKVDPIDAQNAEANRIHAQSEIAAGDYLLTRLAQLGVTSMFGVPGDFNLAFLDQVEDHPTIDWVGNCNELNATYAADGYARVKETSLGVVLTTFGVGELSAMNGIAGGFSEMVPILHIVGAPSTVQQKTRPLLHHTLGDGRYDAFSKASEPLVVYSEHLFSKSTIATQIDAALTECITRARPVYLTLPTDLVNVKISSERLKISLSSTHPPNEQQSEEFVLERIEELVNEANGNVVVLVDACAIRHHTREEITEFLEKTGFPVYATPMGKTAIPEDHPRFGGIYIGQMSHPEIKEKVESAQLIISFGMLATDVNTGGFSYNFPTRRHVELHSNQCRIQYAHFQDISMKELTPKLAERLARFHPIASQIATPQIPFPIPDEDSDIISHAWLWPRMSQFFRPKDIVVSENGTSNFGIVETPFPGGAVLLSQILWGSIGWSVGSALGAALAAKDVGMERVILIVGDGSFQMTVQELSPMIAKGLKPIIFVINNRGYTIERFIRGMTRKYNDVSNWNWTGLLDVFNGDPENIKTESFKVGTKEEMDELLKSEKMERPDKIQLVEVLMDAFDAPMALRRQAELVAKSKGSD